MKRPTVRRVSVAISDIAEAALNELMPYARVGMLSDSRARSWLLKRIVEEGIFALADRAEAERSFCLDIGFAVVAPVKGAKGNGEPINRTYRRAMHAEQIDALLSEVREIDV